MPPSSRSYAGVVVAVLLALAAAGTWSIGDFLGGLTSRRIDSMVVTALSQVAGLVVLAVLLPVLGAPVSTSALAWGALAGIGGAGGLLAYFRALAIGPMGVTAPIAALTGAVLPIGVGIALGERPSALAWSGIALGLVATVLASRPAEEAVVHPETHPERDVAPADVPADEVASGSDLRKGIVAAAIAGVLFGLFFVALDQAPDDSGLWPLLGGRATGLALLGVVLALRRPAPPDRPGTLVGLTSGLLDMVANALFLFAVRSGLLVLVSVLVSLYPVGVVLLARFVLGERLARGQQLGVVLAMAAVVLIAL